MPVSKHKFGIGAKHEDASTAADAFNDMPLLASSDAHSSVEIHLRAGILTSRFSIIHFIKGRRSAHVCSWYDSISFSYLSLFFVNNVVKQTG
jgi:hypothetical protein